SDDQIARWYGTDPARVRKRRHELGLMPVFKRIDTCGGEFESFTPYLYSTYESTTEVVDTGRRKIMVLGGGPNRIGQASSSTTAACRPASSSASAASRSSW